MLACIRRRVQLTLPRPLAFSTIPPRQEDAPKSSAQRLAEIGTVVNMLMDASVTPIIPGMNQSDQSV